MECIYKDKNCYFYNNKKCNRNFSQKCLKEIDHTQKIEKDAKNYWDRLRKK